MRQKKLVRKAEPPSKRGIAWPRWTGFRGKTVWDWMDLLIVPLALVAIGLVFTILQDARQQHFENLRAQRAEDAEAERARQALKIENQRAEAERKLAEQRAQDEALQAYLNQMSQLMLDRKLLEAEPGDPVHTLAQARTSTVILRLDAEHNESVTRFLIDSGLAVRSEMSSKPSPRLLSEITLSHATLSSAYLSSADLSEADLNEADLSGAHLVLADLSDAKLKEANLSDVNLDYADLSDAYVSQADLSDAYVGQAELSDAELSGAKLLGAILIGANLSGATLRGANLRDANLRGANLRDANLSGGADLSGAEGFSNEELEQQAAYLKGATMPNGQKYEDWLKDREKRQQDE